MAKKLPPCILVIEDEPSVRDLIVAFLKLGGHDRVVTAGNAEEALFLIFKDTSLNIRAVLVDLVLPNASGLMVIRKVRSSKYAHRRNLPMIVLTGRTDSDTYKMAARRGIQGYLMKPVSPELLVQTLNEVLAKHGHVPPKPLKPLSGSLHGLGISGPTDVAPPPSLGDDATFGS